MHLRRTLALGAALLAAGAVAVSGAEKPAEDKNAVFPYEVHQTTLDNGLKVVVIPYDSPGTVAYFTVVRTGSRDEVEAGHSGFAHFFEHMMFRGTERYSQAAYNDELKRMGAESNAFTTDDYTNYYIIGPARALETMMDIESDRFKNLKYTEDGFRTEALAVLGEYNKNASSPFLPLEEELRELAFELHTYEHTTMGFLEDVKAMPGYYQYSLSFFDRFYRPENTVVLVVGDAQPQRVFELAKRFYGDWKRGYKAPAVQPNVAQDQPRSGHIDWPNPVRPHLVIGYHAPAFSDAAADSAALSVVSQLLFSQSAPLYQELVVEKQWVDVLAGSFERHRDPYLFTIFARVKSEDLVPKVRQTIEQHIARLQQQPVDRERLERTKSHLRYAFATNLDTPSAIAFTVAEFLSLTGQVESINRLFEQYRTLGPEDVQRVARQTFVPQRQTVVTLWNKGAGQGQAPAAEGGR